MLVEVFHGFVQSYIDGWYWIARVQLVLNVQDSCVVNLLQRKLTTRSQIIINAQWWVSNSQSLFSHCEILFTLCLTFYRLMSHFGHPINQSVKVERQKSVTLTRCLCDMFVLGSITACIRRMGQSNVFSQFTNGGGGGRGEEYPSQVPSTFPRFWFKVCYREYLILW